MRKYDVFYKALAELIDLAERQGINFNVDRARNPLGGYEYKADIAFNRDVPEFDDPTIAFVPVDTKNVRLIEVSCLEKFVALGLLDPVSDDGVTFWATEYAYYPTRPVFDHDYKIGGPVAPAWATHVAITPKQYAKVDFDGTVQSKNHV